MQRVPFTVASLSAAVEEMGEVGVAAGEHPPSPKVVKENGDLNGTGEADEQPPSVGHTTGLMIANVTSGLDAIKTAKLHTDVSQVSGGGGSEVDENSQTSQPVSSSNGQTEGDETSRDDAVDDETEESRPEMVRVDNDNHDTVESMDVDEQGEGHREGKSRSVSENGNDPLGGSVGNLVDEDSKSKSGDEAMDVDASTNGHSVTDKTDDNDVIDDDSDKPVSINSDSENEDDPVEPGKSVATDSMDGNSKSNDTVSMSSKSNGGTAKQNGDCDDVTILSDKEEDCVVIDDEDGDDTNSSSPSQKKSEVEDVSLRRSTRVRKSTMSQNVSTIDDDDDIEEIIDDPLNIAKKPRLSINQSLQQNSFKGQLATSPQKSLLTSNQNSATKEPTLVIIDTNSLINRSIGNTSITASPITSKSANSSFSALPTGISPNSSFNSPRGVLNPVAAAAHLISKNNPPPLAPVTPLLPALTDDMFVLEAPSFIVPYIYEKPPPENLRQIVSELEVKIKEMRKKLEESEKKEEKVEDENSQESTVSGEKKSSTSDPEVESETEKKKKSKRKTRNDDDDDWDELETSTDDEASDEENKTRVLIKEANSDIEMIKEHIITPAKDDLTSTSTTSTGSNAQTDPKKSENYFENPLGKFFMNIGINMVQEYVQTDLLRQQKKKRDREGKPSASTQMAINSLIKNLEFSKENNRPFKFEIKRCEYCPFKSESALAMAHHYETPHMRNYIYKCNFCSYETRPPHDILYHMEAMHNIKGRLEKASMYHACPNCPFEDNGKSKLARHAVACAKKFRPEINLNPPLDWEPPAKIPRIKPKHGLVGTATAYQAMTAQQQKNMAMVNQRVQAVNNINPVNINQLSAAAQAAALRARGGRPQPLTPQTTGSALRSVANPAMRTSMSPGGMVIPNNFQLSPAAIAAAANKFLPNSMGLKPGMKPTQQPSISITPLPRQSNATNMAVAGALSKLQAAGTSAVKPGQSPAGNKTAFVVCEICDGYIKDLDQLRNHMQWIHKVKIHPKMIYNRPPLNCQKCQYRFFTDQGLERHLLGSHGLVTSSMQEAANKGKDAGRCPVCGRVYQWKLLNHVSRDHNMTLKPAHLSYKCTVCTATFGMYKQFESHVYSAHSTVAKKALDNKKPGGPAAGTTNTSMSTRSAAGNDPLLKPLKINDEITIIPQPTAKGAVKPMEIESHVID